MIHATIELVAEKGASKLTLVEVGRRAGYSHTLPNYYFKTKENLLSGVYSNIISRFREWLVVWMKKRPAARRKAGLASFLTLIEGYLEGTRVDSPRARATHVLWAESFSSMPELLDEVRASHRQTVESIAMHIQMGQARGEIRADIDPDVMAQIVIGALRGVVSQKLIDPDQTDLDRISQTLVSLFGHGVGTQPFKDDADAA